MNIYGRDASIPSENSAPSEMPNFTSNSSSHPGADVVWLVWVLLTAILAPLVFGGMLSLLYYYHKTRTSAPPAQDYMQKQEPSGVSFSSHHTIAPLQSPASFITDTKSTLVGPCHQIPQSPNPSIQKPQNPPRYFKKTSLHSHGSEESFLQKALRTRDSPFRASMSSFRGQKESLELEAISSCNDSIRESRARLDQESLIDFYARHVRNDSGSTVTGRASHQLPRNTFGEAELLMGTECARDDKSQNLPSNLSA